MGCRKDSIRPPSSTARGSTYSALLRSDECDLVGLRPLEVRAEDLEREPRRRSRPVRCRNWGIAPVRSPFLSRIRNMQLWYPRDAPLSNLELAPGRNVSHAWFSRPHAHPGKGLSHIPANIPANPEPAISFCASQTLHNRTFSPKH